MNINKEIKGSLRETIEYKEMEKATEKITMGKMNKIVNTNLLQFISLTLHNIWNYRRTEMLYAGKLKVKYL